MTLYTHRHRIMHMQDTRREYGYRVPISLSGQVPVPMVAQDMTGRPDEYGIHACVCSCNIRCTVVGFMDI